MSSKNRRVSLSPSERKQNRSRSSSRSRRTSSNVVDRTHQSRKQSNQTKRSPSLTSSKSNKSRRQKSKSKSASSKDKKHSKKKKSTTSLHDTDSKQEEPRNDAEKQDLTSRGLSVVPTEIFDLVTLRRLILSNNNLACLPPNIRELVNLEYLDLSRNPLRVKNGLDDYSCLPREFRYLRNLQTLIMAECTLKHIPAVVWTIVSLRTLDISRNKVGYIIGEIGNLIDIENLRLSQMDLDTLPPEIGFCDKLQTIDLTGNPIDNLPETLVECRQLTEIKINYQNFFKFLDNYMLQLIDDGKIRSEHIPHVIFELESLDILDLNQTKLNYIPNDHTLIHLNELYLSNNSFHQIPESICSMNQLKILDMSNNRLQTIPDYFIQIKQLKILNLSSNQLIILPANLSQIQTLTNLIVNRNRIETIDKEFCQSLSLLSLDLAYNQLKILPEYLSNLKQLETLDLRYNQIEYLPLTFQQMKNIKSMNTFDDDFQRSGLHLLGNPLIDPPSYIWKSTSIQTLFDYIETKEKTLSNFYTHFKLIFLGPKNSGKTTLVSKLTSHSRKTLDAYISIIQNKQINSDNQPRISDKTSSILTDQWIESRVSMNGEYFLQRSSKIKRIYPPPLKTYRQNEIFNYFMQKTILTTKNNLYCTIFDITSEPSFEILYPLIYDPNALFILPVNLTVLLNIINAATSLDSSEDIISIIDYESLLTLDWLYFYIFRYIESIADHCHQASIAIVGLISNSQLNNSNDYHQQLLDEIHSRINMFLTNEDYQRKNIHLYSDYFPEPIYFDNEQISNDLIEKFEIIAQKWNMKYPKQINSILKQHLQFFRDKSILIDYETSLKSFEEVKSLLPQELTFDECLEYLKLLGDILYFPQLSPTTIIVKPYFLFNNILCRTIFRPDIDRWLNYDENLLFRFTGYYRTNELFENDRERLLNRGEFTWNMLNVLFFQQNNSNRCLIDENIVQYCEIMERLSLGFIHPTNLNYHEFANIYFVCPWLLNEKQTLTINFNEYFLELEQKRTYENLRTENSRKLKQQQLWFGIDERENQPENLFDQNLIQELPSSDQISISKSQIIHSSPLIRMKIFNKSSHFLPIGFYERLLICLHSFYNERLDYSNRTIGRTIENELIEIERTDEENSISLITNHSLLERLQTNLNKNLFSFYPSLHFRIET